MGRLFRTPRQRPYREHHHGREYIYIPANAPQMIASDDEDVISSRSSISPSIIGKLVDGTMAGPHCGPDYGPD
jgi:hypothetical protein